MKPLMLLTVLLAACFLSVRAEEPATEPIFNGKDLSGWEGGPEYWSVKDGCMTGVTDGTLKYNRFIMWKGGTLKNFELRVQVKVTTGGNSGQASDRHTGVPVRACAWIRRRPWSSGPCGRGRSQWG